MSSKTIYFFFTILLLTSCGVKQISTDRFAPMSNPSELNGRYVNNNGDRYMSNILFDRYRNVDDSYYRSIDIVNLDFPTNDSLIISFIDNTGNKTIKLKGKQKDNYFEFYNQKERFYLPPFFIKHWIDKRRIGKNRDGDLEIHKYNDDWGSILFLGNGISTADSWIFKSYKENSDLKLLSVNINNKWGYKDQNDSIVITPQYDYAQAFEDGLAKVSLDNKWGYIDSANQIIIPIIYDLIIPPEDGLLRVVKDSKWGIIDLNNNIIVPFEYDKIDGFGNNMTNDSLFQKLAKVYKRNKVGFINSKGEEIIPTVYDTIDNFSGDYFHQTKLGSKYGYVTGNGVFCEPIFDKVGFFRDGNFSISNKRVFDKIGRYAKVKYKGESYILGENGIIYPYTTEALSFINPDVAILKVDFEKGIKVSR